ncbi:MAG: hypothetical protein V7603_1618, partial [Micromonosporaceae bacterium]
DAGSDAAGAPTDLTGLGMSCDGGLRVPEPRASVGPGPRPLPADFVPVSAGRCVFTTVTVTGDGEWQVRDEQQATGGFDALLRALRQPSRENAGGACPAIGYLPIVITLTDAGGRTVTPAVPHGACGEPLPAAPAAIRALSWHTVKQTKVSRLRSQLELDSGCPGAYKPVIAFEADESIRKSPAVGPLFPGSRPAALQVCRFRLDPADTMSMNGARTLAMGKLATAARLTGAGLTRFLAALDAAPGARACDRPQAPFALLFPVGSAGPSVTVELAGCYRVDDGDGNLRQLDAGPVAALAVA